ncbi:MAG TPA: lytic transglycosylase domain-containing protein [Candidatus Eremiobacteraceae bacterium]|nr:lytic transglycosylase domain-containing protein [Candidatus Eremiobacteraceae bacterium]
MNIDPIAFTHSTPAAPATFATYGDFGETTVVAKEPQLAPASDVFTELEGRFSAMIASVSKQLAALEQKVAGALRELVAQSRAAARSASPAGPTEARRSPTAFGGVIDAAAQRHELDPALLSAVIERESNYDPHAISKAGAMGLMQLMPDTARGLGVRDPFDPAQNIEGGATYLRGLIDRYHGRLDIALAAYNAGPGAVDHYGGVPPYAETRAYVQGILGAYRRSALAG